jgi:hypothetical protein
MAFGQQGGAYLAKQPQPEAPYPVFSIVDTFVQPALTGTGVYWVTKATAAAVTLAPASSVAVGTIVIFQAGTAAAHVITAQSGGIFDGTTGSKTKWTSAAFIGSSITLMSAPNGGWSVLAQQAGTVA